MPPTQPEQRAAVAGMARSHEVRCRGHGTLLPHQESCCVPWERAMRATEP